MLNVISDNSSRDRQALVNHVTDCWNNLEDQRETKRNVTKMVILTSLIFLLANILNPITFFYRQFFSLMSENVLSLISNTLLFGSHGVNIFVYYNYNTNYRRAFKNLLTRRQRLELREIIPIIY